MKHLKITINLTQKKKNEEKTVIKSFQIYKIPYFTIKIDLIHDPLKTALTGTSQTQKNIDKNILEFFFICTKILTSNGT